MRVTYNQLSEMTGKTYRTIKKYLDSAGVNPIADEGNKIFFDSVDALECIYTHKASCDTGNIIEMIDEEKHRKLKRENDEADNLVAPVSMLSDAMIKAFSQILPIMDSLPVEMKRKNPQLTGHDIQLAKKAIAKCRNAMAAAKISADE
ncbi:MAG: terminase small subunit [Proteobacteria bacterium]|nr:terminase small subunit [Pseudomonadota bacterium]